MQTEYAIERRSCEDLDSLGPVNACNIWETKET